MGIDPSLTAAGIAVIRPPVGNPPRDAPEAVSVGTKGQSGAPVAVRAARIHDQTVRILHTMPADTRLVVIEALPPQIPGAHGMHAERAALWWQLVAYLSRQAIPVAEVAPTTLKKWATGHGRATKSQVVAAMRALWPHTTIRDDNQADALALATIGAQRIGWHTPAHDHHHTPNITWPEGAAS
ncbi:crossover junction endodeoxyribonuclease RuvC [Tomitella fengzijianii]|uniref:crossover junction endodeoxyribonuclease RuvC n=1 Tax=Tomitella fengzijianii TaxID=2597660 RepID=UPI001F448446|nr:crossover junction endodeoxyribonuclease RuvC [Tomitella fengzijianii]